MTNTVDIPDADNFDSADYASGWSADLYLEPSLESEAAPRIRIHDGYGTTGCPGMAYDQRWVLVGSYGAGVVGESVLAALQRLAPLLCEVNAEYLGSEWHERAHRVMGRWLKDEVDSPRERLREAWDEIELQTYWDAGDWFCNGEDWTWACAETGLPLTSTVEEIEAALVVEDHVQGVSAWLEWARDEWVTSDQEG